MISYKFVTLQQMENITAVEAARVLGISLYSLGRLRKHGIIRATYVTKGGSFYSSQSIDRLRGRGGYMLSDEAAETHNLFHRKMASVAFMVAAVGVVIGVSSFFFLFQYPQQPKVSDLAAEPTIKIMR